MSSVCCAEISEDGSMMAVGFSDSRIKVWSLVPQKLKAMKNAEQLQDINLETGCCFFSQFSMMEKINYISNYVILI